MRIYTRTGDKGMTGIFGRELRSKDDVRIECNGKLDEANSFIGLLYSKLKPDHVWQEKLRKVQTDIMDMMSHMPTHSVRREDNKVKKPVDGAGGCEKWIGEIKR